jgi:hypothetical protein
MDSWFFCKVIMLAPIYVLSLCCILAYQYELIHTRLKYGTLIYTLKKVKHKNEANK